MVDESLDTEIEQVLDGLGARLRMLRSRRGTTLADLSETTGISVSTLSRLESGKRRPTLELLLVLAKAHGATLDELVGAPQTGDPRVNLRPIPSKRKYEATIPLTRRPGGLQAYKHVLRPDPNPPAPKQQVHEGYEWLYVLNGKLRVLLGEDSMTLEPGDVVEFDTRTPHWFGPIDGKAVEFLSLFGPQGERAHTHVRRRRG